MTENLVTGLMLGIARAIINVSFHSVRMTLCCMRCVCRRKRACHQGYNGYGSNCNTERVWELAHLRNAIKGGPGRRRR